MQCQTSGQNITEFFSLMGVIRETGSAGLQSHEDGFHIMLLGIGDDPFDFIVQFLILFFKIIRAGENNLFFPGLIEEISQAMDGEV